MKYYFYYKKIENKQVDLISTKHDKFLNKHKKFLDYILLKYKEEGWNLVNYCKPTTADLRKIESLINLYLQRNNCDKRTIKFYKLIIRAVPLIFDKKKCVSGISLRKSLNTGSELISRHVAPYLNPNKYQRRENYGYLLDDLMRNHICKEIYKIFKTEGLELENQYILKKLKLILKKVKKKQIIEIHEKLSNPEFLKLIKRNLMDLIEIIRALFDYSTELNDKVYVNTLARELIDSGKVLKYKFNGLNRAITEIFKILKDLFEDFDLERNQLLIDDDLLNLDRDYIYSKYPNIKKSELAQIKVFLKEIKIIDELNINYPKYLRNQCEECDTDIKFLPAIQFHHIKDEKNISWDEIKYLPYKTVRKLMMHEDLKVICNNCHLKKQATIYHQFRDFINSLNLNRDTIKATKRLINEELNKRDIKINKKRIRAWIYKKYLIEQYYNGECASCGKCCTDDNLPIFIFSS